MPYIDWIELEWAGKLSRRKERCKYTWTGKNKVHLYRISFVTKLHSRSTSRRYFVGSIISKWVIKYITNKKKVMYICKTAGHLIRNSAILGLGFCCICHLSSLCVCVKGYFFIYDCIFFLFSVFSPTKPIAHFSLPLHCVPPFLFNVLTGRHGLRFGPW